jgi:nitrate reductase NapD
MNVSSVVVQTVPKYLDGLVEDLKNCDACDYHMHDEKGRIIITIEGEGVAEELKKNESYRIITSCSISRYANGI